MVKYTQEELVANQAAAEAADAYYNASAEDPNSHETAVLRQLAHEAYEHARCVALKIGG